MAIDRTTEAIAHFIGLFALSVEKMISREQYSEFRAAQNARDDLEAINAVPFSVNSGYKLKDYDPNLSYTPAGAGLGDPQPASTGGSVIPQGDVANIPFAGPAGTGIVPMQASEAAGTVTVSYILPLPSSVVAVTIQLNTLSDSDSLGVTADDMFAAPAVFDAMVAQVVEVAESLQGFATPILQDAADGWQSFADSALDQIAEAAATEAAAETLPEGATVTVLSGESTVGITINGEDADEVPELDDLLPSFLQVDDPEEETPEDDLADADADDAAALTDDGVDATLSTQSGDDGDQANNGSGTGAGGTQVITASVVSDTDAVEPHDIDNDFEGGRPDSPWQVEDGHVIVAGANTQLNETQVASSWLDADVIAVQGDVYEVDAISQVNVLAGADVVNGELAEATSTALNIVEIVETSSNAPEEVEEDETADVATGPETVEEEAAEPDPLPYAGLPADSVVVRVDADVTQINWTVQESYLNDHDTAVVTIGASVTYIGLGENDAFNEAFLTESGFNYDLILVSGDMIDINMITQTNILLDGGTIDTSALVDVISGDNVQVNLAQLNTVGIDTHTELEEPFEQSIVNLADGAEDVTSAVESSDLFEGTELLRVLYIEGDLTTVNVVVQNNVLGDVDQLNVAHAAIEAAQNLEDLAASITADVAAEIEVVTGSNAQANVAALNDFGVDSTVMAGGEVYSDALLHQADLIDMDAVPTGVELTGLTNEAVAFLADDLVADLSTLGDDIIASTNASMTDMPGTADIMQLALS